MNPMFEWILKETQYRRIIRATKTLADSGNCEVGRDLLNTWDNGELKVKYGFTSVSGDIYIISRVYENQSGKWVCVFNAIYPYGTFMARWIPELFDYGDWCNKLLRIKK
jgi:hypothetical protein